MTRWLNWDDWVSIQELQSRGVQLDIERAVLWPHSPLYAAISAHLPFSPIGADTIILYLPSKRGRAIGFLQVRPRSNRPEADVTFLAPSLEADEDAVSIWYRLLAECTQCVGDQGGQRIFTQVSDNNGTEDVFRQAGFTVYAHEDIYWLGERPGDMMRTQILRHQRSRDAWNLLRLYAQTTPRPVQIAEGMLSPEGHSGKIREWWDQSRGSGYVLPVGHEIGGAVRLLRGRAAYWLRFWLNPAMHDYGDPLLRGALSLLWAAPRRPIYVSIREYQSGLRAPLEELGFRFWRSRSLMVKHTTARVKEPLMKLVPALEKRAEPAASVAHHSDPRPVSVHSRVS